MTGKGHGKRAERQEKLGNFFIQFIAGNPKISIGSCGLTAHAISSGPLAGRSVFHYPKLVNASLRFHRKTQINPE
jgi:hypothetical protein